MKKSVTGFLNALGAPVYGAGFKKDGLNIEDHPNLISFDGHSVYFSGLGEKEAARLLDEVALLNGRTGWLAYILQEVYYDDRDADILYEAIYDGIDTGIIKGPADLTRESIFKWVEAAAPEIEKIRQRLPGGKGQGPL